MTMSSVFGFAGERGRVRHRHLTTLLVFFVTAAPSTAQVVAASFGELQDVLKQGDWILITEGREMKGTHMLYPAAEAGT